MPEGMSTLRVIPLDPRARGAQARHLISSLDSCTGSSAARAWQALEGVLGGQGLGDAAVHQLAMHHRAVLSGLLGAAEEVRNSPDENAQWLLTAA